MRLNYYDIYFIIIFIIVIYLNSGYSYRKDISNFRTSNIRLFQSGILTQSFLELSNLMGGKGKARIIWKQLREGINPLYYNNTNDNNMDENEYLSTKAKLRLIEILDNKPLLSGFVVQESQSECSTRKLLIKLEDDQLIESVLIPSSKFDRTTLCVSTQIGCDRGCSFCLTGYI